MTKPTLLATAAALALAVAAPAAFAQSFTGTGGNQSFDDRIDDVQENTDDIFDRSQDDDRFSNQRFGPGWTGSISAAGTLSSGNTESTDFTLAGRVRNSTGPWNQTVGLAFSYGESNDVEDEKSVFGIYDVNRSLSDRLYLFGLARAEYDEFNLLRRDGFAGAGLGYRIFNTPDLAWRVQAGPGVRFLEFNGSNEDETEFGAIASSFFYYEFADNMAFTNDTDVVYSDSATVVTNDAGLNLRVTDLISTRLGYRTTYVAESDIADDFNFDEADNEFTAALVFSIR